jgi:GNAT superfamily N-acetyltransferase
LQESSILNTRLKIREAKITDIPYLLRLTMELAQDTKAQLNKRVLESGMIRFFEEECHGKYFVLTAAERPVGQIIIKPVVFEPWKNSLIVWVDDFQVSRPYNSSHNMQKLLTHGIEWAVAQQPQQIVRLHCPQNHPRMLHALSQLGFEAIGYLMQQSQEYFFDDKPSLYNIRQATIEDHETIVSFTMSLATGLGDGVNSKTLKDGVRNFLENPVHGKYFLACKNKKPIGQILIKHTLMEPWHNSRVIWVDDAYVNEGYRGKGIMKLLLQQGIEWANQREPEEIVRLYCAFSNVGGAICWTNFGFEPIGFMMQQRQEFGLID